MPWLWDQMGVKNMPTLTAKSQNNFAYEYAEPRLRVVQFGISVLHSV